MQPGGDELRLLRFLVLGDVAGDLQLAARSVRGVGENRALQLYTNLRFYHVENDAILFYGKMTPARDNIILVVVNLDPFRKQHSFVYVPIDEFGQMESDTYQVHDLLNGARYTWRGRRNYVELDPDIQPAHIFLVRR